MSAGAWCWLVAAITYGAFRLWYDNHRGPLKPAEIAHFLGIHEKYSGSEHTGIALLRNFLEQDDGREFLMVNMVRLHPNQQEHPKTGRMTDPSELLKQYFAGFSKVMLRYGGHPMMATRKVGPYVDSWNVPPDPGWSITGLVRYRSRRDMMRLSTHPDFFEAHAFKLKSIELTYSFPSQAVVQMAVGPRTAVGLVLALAAALAHLAILVH